jgi:phage terminase large subunit
LPIELKPAGYNAETDAPYMRISNKRANTTIFGESGDNIGRGARASVYFKDESAHYAQAESIDAALSQTSNCQIDVSTPNGEGNAFWRKRMGGHVQLFIFDWREDPRKDDKWYEAQKLRMTPVALAAEVDRDYSASITNSFIDGNRVGDAQRRGPMEVKASGYLQVGLDVARFGDDSNVLTFRRGRVLLKQVTWRKSDLESTAGRCRSEITAWKEIPAQIAVDTIGVGAGVADMLRNFPGYRDIVVDVNSSLRMSDGQNYNLRAAMWVQMRDWLSTASIPNSTELRSALTALRYFYKGGELLLESKDDAKKRGIASPDEADSLALTFAYPVKPPRREPDASAAPDVRPDPETGM